VLLPVIDTIAGYRHRETRLLKSHHGVILKIPPGHVSFACIKSAASQRHGSATTLVLVMGRLNRFSPNHLIDQPTE
jgi:hypothetical protein